MSLALNFFGLCFALCSLDIEYIMSVATNIPTTFWSTAGQQPHNPENEPFLTFLMNVAKTEDNATPKTISTSYGDDEPGVNHACTFPHACTRGFATANVLVGGCGL